MIKRALLYSIVFLSLFSCKKEGCKDQNSVNFDEDATEGDGFCVHAYITDIQVNKLASVKNEGNITETTWDPQAIDIVLYPDETYPDIEIRLKKGFGSSGNVLHYSNAYHNNKYFPISTQIPVVEGSFIELNEYYTVEIVDLDSDGTEEMLSLSFKYSDVNNQVYTYSANNKEITIYFIEQ